MDATGGGRGPKFCQAENCFVDVRALGRCYCLKKTLCPQHLKADSVKCKNKLGDFRFCFQCGKLEPLARFAGNKRSCRLSLGKKRGGQEVCLNAPQGQSRNSCIMLSSAFYPGEEDSQRPQHPGCCTPAVSGSTCSNNDSIITKEQPGLTQQQQQAALRALLPLVGPNTQQSKQPYCSQMSVFNPVNDVAGKSGMQQYQQYVPDPVAAVSDAVPADPNSAEMSGAAAAQKATAQAVPAVAQDPWDHMLDLLLGEGAAEACGNQHHSGEFPDVASPPLGDTGTCLPPSSSAAGFVDPAPTTAANHYEGQLMAVAQQAVQQATVHEAPAGSAALPAALPSAHSTNPPVGCANAVDGDMPQLNIQPGPVTHHPLVLDQVHMQAQRQVSEQLATSAAWAPPASVVARNGLEAGWLQAVQVQLLQQQYMLLFCMMQDMNGRLQAIENVVLHLQHAKEKQGQAFMQ